MAIVPLAISGITYNLCGLKMILEQQIWHYSAMYGMAWVGVLIQRVINGKRKS